MKKLLAATLLICSTLFVTGCGESENIGYVDQKKIMTEAPQMTAIMEDGTKKMEEIETDIKTQLEGNPEMSDEDREKLMADFERKVSGINQAYATQIDAKLNAALAEVCQSKNVTVVIDNTAGQKLLISGGIDITDDVIAKLK